MSDVKFKCPECANNILIDEHAGGFEVACPHCSSPVTVPKGQAPLTGNENAGRPSTRGLLLTTTMKCPHCGIDVLDIGDKKGLTCPACEGSLDGSPKVKTLPCTPAAQRSSHALTTLAATHVSFKARFAACLLAVALFVLPFGILVATCKEGNLFRLSEWWPEFPTWWSVAQRHAPIAFTVAVTIEWLGECLGDLLGAVFGPPFFVLLFLVLPVRLIYQSLRKTPRGLVLFLAPDLERRVVALAILASIAIIVGLSLASSNL